MIAERLKFLRNERNLTQRAVARGADIGERQYQAYEYGEKKPGCDILIALADFFDVSADYILGRTNDPHMHR